MWIRFLSVTRCTLYPPDQYDSPSHHDITTSLILLKVVLRTHYTTSTLAVAKGAYTDVTNQTHNSMIEQDANECFDIIESKVPFTWTTISINLSRVVVVGPSESRNYLWQHKHLSIYPSKRKLLTIWSCKWMLL